MKNPDYLDNAIEIAKKAGEIMTSMQSVDIQTNWKADGTPLTQADTTINKMVIDEIAQRFPDHAVLGEEESSESDSSFVWVTDPIDGTIPYSHGLTISTFSLALVWDGNPVAGVVYDPFQDRLYAAEKDAGATANGQPIHVNNRKTIKDAVISMNGPEFFSDIHRGLIEGWAFPFIPQSFAYGAKQIASGHFTGGIFGWNNPWDCVAVKIIVEEAGGKATDYVGNDQRYDQKLNGFIVSNGLVHDELLEIVSSARKNWSGDSTYQKILDQ